MGVIIEKNCVRMPDGRLLCWDMDECKLYLLTKDEVEPGSVADAVLADLMRRTLKPLKSKEAGN